MNARILIGTTLAASLALAICCLYPAERDHHETLPTAAQLADVLQSSESASMDDSNTCSGELAFFMLFTKPSPLTLPDWFFPPAEACITHPHVCQPGWPYYVQI